MSFARPHRDGGLQTVRRQDIFLFPFVTCCGWTNRMIVVFLIIILAPEES